MVLWSPLDMERRIKYDYYNTIKILSENKQSKKRTVSASELFESDEEISKSITRMISCQEIIQKYLVMS
jgi:hypothetical protein